MLLIAALNLYASYTANIVALLQSTTDSIKTPADLLHSPLKLGAQDVVYSRHYFKVPLEILKKFDFFHAYDRNLRLDRYAEFPRSDTKSDSRAKDRAEGSKRFVDVGRGRCTPRQKRTVCVSRGTRRPLQNYAGNVLRGGEMWDHGDRRNEHVGSASGHSNSIPVFRDRQERVR